MSRHLMLVPSLACPASCAYCFGPHRGTGTMSREVVKAVVDWQKSCNGSDPLEITFHGGEPLTAGIEFYRYALPHLKEDLAPRRVRFAMQSNLWLLNDELGELFREFRVSIGTSLDGPEEINDRQRGAGYFRKTWAGMELAQKNGLHPGCICTFTKQSLPYAAEIFDFFVREGIDFSVHAALPSLRNPDAGPWSLTPAEHGELLTGMLGRYLAQMEKIRISTLDGMIRGVSSGKGGICTFGDCLGGYLAVGPDGGIYPCQRFAGMSEYAIANVLDWTSLDQMASSPVWRLFQERQEHIHEECGDCVHFDYCRGGCPYNALVGYGGQFKMLRDPDCPAYQKTFSVILDIAMKEVFSSKNMAAVVQEPDADAGLLRHGKLVTLMRGGPHPLEVAGQARRVLAATALATVESAEEAVNCLKRLTAFSRIDLNNLKNLNQRLTSPVNGLNNLYLHVTFDCNLQCTHCYATAGPNRKEVMAVEHIERACFEAARFGFRHVVITGGEPLVHPGANALLDVLARLRQPVKPLLTVLRTNLAREFDPKTLKQISRSTDQVVVSVDGDRETHDARRGKGSYVRTVGNLRRLIELGGDTDVSVAAILPIQLVNGVPGDSVRSLACELGIRRIRFKPVMPLGRAMETEPDIVPEALWGHLDPENIIGYGFNPTASCGMGQNLYIEPDGGAYPCYAWCGREWFLGSIQDSDGLKGVLDSAAFQDLRTHNVNSNRLCRRCSLRYLCGGACRAWNRLETVDEGIKEAVIAGLDDPPLNCSVLHDRARSVLKEALSFLGIREDEWLGAGFKIPEHPPFDRDLDH